MAKWRHRAQGILVGLGLAIAIVILIPQLRQSSEPKPNPPPLSTSSPISAASSPKSSVEGYAQLEGFLKTRQWKAADRETRRLMLQIADREQPGWMDDRSMAQFPCSELQTIDRLWSEASNDKFSFSVQHQIWQEVGADLGRMSDRVGWRQQNAWVPYDDLNFDLQAPVGHLPSGDGLGLWLDGMRVGRGYPLLDSALIRCGT